jgi:hypothetical protein
MSAAPLRHSNPIIPTVTAVCVNRSEGPAALVSPALPPPAPKVADAAPAASPAGTKPDPAWLEAIEVSDRVGASHSAALPARLDHIDVGRSTTKLKASPRLYANQKRFGCTIEDGMVFCGSPGTGMYWKKGHNPSLGQPALAISVGNAPWGHGPDEGHGERWG